MVASTVVINQFLETLRFVYVPVSYDRVSSATIVPRGAHYSAQPLLFGLNQMSVAFLATSPHAGAGTIAFKAATQYSASLSLVVANRRIIFRA